MRSTISGLRFVNLHLENINKTQSEGLSNIQIF